ncbi:MAG: hypothetical protein Q8R20_03565 [Nanoarchaeota archaeon]|nr:hypothetical protein [Nanoarchaeota archaeon]
MKKMYDKLVRGLIPEIIRKGGGKPKVRVAKDTSIELSTPACRRQGYFQWDFDFLVFLAHYYFREWFFAMVLT